jgi:hypothetical protein
VSPFCVGELLNQHSVIDAVSERGRDRRMVRVKAVRRDVGPHAVRDAQRHLVGELAGILSVPASNVEAKQELGCPATFDVSWSIASPNRKANSRPSVLNRTTDSAATVRSAQLWWSTFRFFISRPSTRTADQRRRSPSINPIHFLATRGGGSGNDSQCRKGSIPRF